ncbi:MAG: 16S rRNA (cytidine(1402)-2'-O)-methyltransferase, partial [Chloroflexota bacterium]
MTTLAPGAEAAPGGTLYLVATPIGNLGDITIRAIEILKSVPLIAAEDTRVTRKLLTRYQIATHAISYHAQSDPGKLAKLLAHMRGGGDLALVTDAGTPTVSDPGAEIAAAWAAEGGRVEAMPGASAALVAVAVSGLAGPRWSFEGFLPRRGSERRDRIARLAADERGAVIFETPRRLGTTLADLAAACGSERPAAICRELTKIHEQVLRLPLGALSAAVGDGAVPALGEAVIVLGWYPGGSGSATARSPEAGAVDVAVARVADLVASGTPRGEAARLVSA